MFSRCIPISDVVVLLLVAPWVLKRSKSLAKASLLKSSHSCKAKVVKFGNEPSEDCGLGRSATIDTIALLALALEVAVVLAVVAGRSELLFRRLLLLDVRPTMETAYSQVKPEFRQRAHPVFSPLQRICNRWSRRRMCKV